MKPSTPALNALRIMRAKRAELDAAERRSVTNARALGATWREIGDALGMARTNAHRKFKSV